MSRFCQFLNVLILLSIVGGCKALVPQPGIIPFKHRLEQGQLILFSDFSLPEKHRIVEELLLTRTHVCEDLKLSGCDKPIQIYLFSDESSYVNFLELRFPDYLNRRAIFVETDVALSVYAFWGDHIAKDLRHEVVHGYLHAAITNIPLWLDEGLAEYYEVARHREGLNEEHLHFLHHQPEFNYDLKRLEALASAATMTHEDYAESWAWVHYLMHSGDENRNLLIGYLAALQAGKPDPSLSTRLQNRLSTPELAVAESIEQLR